MTTNQIADAARIALARRDYGSKMALRETYADWTNTLTTPIQAQRSVLHAMTALENAWDNGAPTFAQLRHLIVACERAAS